MHIVVSNASSDPIYQQIADQIRTHIIDGLCSPESFCPPSEPWLAICR